VNEEQLDRKGPRMKEQVRTFLAKRSARDWVKDGVLSERSNMGFILNGSSITPLIAAMKRAGIDRLEAGSRWSLSVDGRFTNTFSGYRSEMEWRRQEKTRHVFRNANRHINPHYVRSQESGLQPGSAPGSSTRTRRLSPIDDDRYLRIFSQEDISKPENRCNLALFHLQMWDQFHDWFLGRLGFAADAVLYPATNSAGTRPDFVLELGDVKIGAVEVELGGADHAQLAEYRKSHPNVTLIAGKKEHTCPLSLEEIAEYLHEHLAEAPSQQVRMSAMYLHALIDVSVGGRVGSHRAPVSEKVLEHPFFRALLSNLADIARGADEAAGPSPGHPYYDTQANEGFSMQVYSPKRGKKSVSLFYRTGGRDVLCFQKAEHYRKYLTDRDVDTEGFVEFITRRFGLRLEANRESVALSEALGAVTELAQWVRKLA
jgi:hypothetical protein